MAPRKKTLLSGSKKGNKGRISNGISKSKSTRQKKKKLPHKLPLSQDPFARRYLGSTLVQTERKLTLFFYLKQRKHSQQNIYCMCLVLIC